MTGVLLEYRICGCLPHGGADVLSTAWCGQYMRKPKLVVFHLGCELVFVQYALYVLYKNVFSYSPTENIFG